MAFIANQSKIEPTVTQVLEDIASPTCEREANLSRHRENLATEDGRDDRGRIVCRRNPEGTVFCHGVECRARDEPVQFRQHDLKLLKNTFSEQVKQTKASTIEVAERHFNAPVDTIEGTVKSASAYGVELTEYPGRTFHFSSVGSSMADLTAASLGRSNKITKDEAVIEADTRRAERDLYLADVLAQGTHVTMVVPKGRRGQCGGHSSGHFGR